MQKTAGKRAFFTLAALTATVVSGVGARQPDQRKHDRKIESWSLCARIGSSYEHSRYFGLFYFSGSLMMMSGTFAHCVLLDMPQARYSHDGRTFIKPFARIKHAYDRLHEQFGDNRIIRADSTGEIIIDAALSDVAASFRVTPRTPHIAFEHVYDKDPAHAAFDWYLYPNARVDASFADSDNLHPVSGEGHFQQFWGEKAGHDADWLVIHADNEMTILVAVVSEKIEQEPWLPGNYVLVSSPDGQRRKYTRFSYDIIDTWQSPRNAVYPTALSIKGNDSSFSIQVRAFTPEQESRSLGSSAWIGFARAHGTLAGEPFDGWAYMSVWGRK